MAIGPLTGPRRPHARRRGFAAPGGGFTPAALPSLQLWLTAGPTWCFTDAGATTPCGDGDPVRVWKDRSGNARNFSQASSSLRPTLFDLGGGVWTVTFDGVDDLMSTPDAAGLSITGSLTILWAGAVASLPANSGQRQVLLEKTQYDGEYRVGFLSENPGNPLKAGQGDGAGNFDGQDVIASLDTAWHALVAKRTGAAAWQGYKDATPSASYTNSQTPVDTAGDLYLGARAGGFEPYNGRFGEVVLCSAALSDADRGAAEAYLKAAWGTP